MMSYILLFLPFLLRLASGFPAATSSKLLTRGVTSITSFIALGESYASGVGAGTADQSVFLSRCLRYDQAYPRVLARDDNMAAAADAGESRLINNACSGHSIPDILQKQFIDKDGGGFKAFGKPQFATISAAGDDIGFKDLVLSCIYEAPNKPNTCQDQIKKSADTMEGEAFTILISQLINKTLDSGLPNHKDFRVYFTGYPQFFNVEPTTPDFCSQKTWSLCKPYLTPGKKCEFLPLTVDLRKQLNTLSTTLNSKIQSTINTFADKHKDSNGKPLVKFVDIDNLVQGHRYCEQGKEEPVKNDDDIWFFQWLDDETKNDAGKKQFYDLVAQTFFNNTDALTLGEKQLNGTITIGGDDFLEHEVSVANANPAVASSIDAEGTITNRVKTFHPKIQYHKLIEQKILGMVEADFKT